MDIEAGCVFTSKRLAPRTDGRALAPDGQAHDEAEQLEGGTEPDWDPGDLLAHEAEEADPGNDQDSGEEGLLRALMKKVLMAKLQPQRSPSALNTSVHVFPAAEQKRQPYRRLTAAGLLRKQPRPDLL